MIGVHPKIFLKISELKKLYLIFNKICLLTEEKHVKGFKSLHEKSGSIPPDVLQFLDEFDYLMEKGIVFNPNIEEVSKVNLNQEYINLKQDLNESVGKMKRTISETQNQDLGQILKEVSSFQNEAQNTSARIISLYLQQTHNYESYPILSFDNLAVHNLSDYNTKKADVLQIILKNIPVPNEKTSWEQLIEFRNDPLTIDKFLQLKNWINDISKMGLSVIEIEDKFDYLVKEYKNHMKIHKMNTNPGFIETTVSLTAQSLENFVKLKWGNLAKTLFYFKHRKLDLMKAEMQVPGRELSYIVYTQKYF